MATHCAGTQGSYLRVSGFGESFDFVTGGGAESFFSSAQAGGWAVWGVYTATVSGGRVVEGFRGYHGKYGDDSFAVWKPTATSNRLVRASNYNATLASWTHSTTSWINRLVFSHGERPYTIYRSRLIAPTGSALFDRSSTAGYYTISELECGCNTEDCQRGSFPTDFCCTNCSHQAGILSAILGALRG